MLFIFIYETSKWIIVQTFKHYGVPCNNFKIGLAGQGGGLMYISDVYHKDSLTPRPLPRIQQQIN